MFDALQNLIIFRFQDAIDILVVAVIIYVLILFIKDTRAQTLVNGLVFLVLIQQVSQLIGLYTLTFILKSTMQVGLVAIMVVFQPELRAGLEQMGSTSRIRKLFFMDNSQGDSELEGTIKALGVTAAFFSNNKIGSLIVIEREYRLPDVVRTGVLLNCDISSAVLVNIFTPNTPLHDGAVIIRNNKIVSAACLLPLTANRDLNIELGTRHRAALGIAETSDAIVIVTSEETGKISVAINGGLTRNLTQTSLEKMLQRYMAPQIVVEKSKKSKNSKK